MTSEITKSDKFLHGLNIWIRQWIEIVESIVVIFTFTFYHPNWSMRYLAWDSKIMLNRRIRRKENNSND